MRSWRSLIGAGAAIAAAVLLVSEAGASGGAMTSASLGEVEPGETAVAATPPDLGPVTVADIDGGTLAAAQAGPDGGPTVTQTIELAVIGGDLELSTPAVTVVLEPVAGSDSEWTGVVPPVRTVDARGTHAGWEVRWAVDAVTADGLEVAGPRVTVAPGPVEVVAGLPDGLRAGEPSAHPRGCTLFAAAPGAGGGTYEAGATISVRLPGSSDVASVAVDLSFVLV